jgi:micrococcal nuclease
VKQFSDRDRWGAFAHREPASLKNFRARGRDRRRRRFLLLLCAACVIGFAAPFAATFVRDRLSTSLSANPHSRPVVMPAPPRAMLPGFIPICSRWNPVRSTCLVDGDTGWERGFKWRLAEVDTPELGNPGCPDERRKALEARDRLQALMSSGYQLTRLGRRDKFGRELVRISLSDGRDAGHVLLAEGLAQRWPHSAGNVWCNR